MKYELVDGKEREEALNPDNSYIIQAPAGSGKTGLLVQRILALLKRVDNPEEVLALTFTRKAASEMRDRIIQALIEAESGEKPEEDYKLTSWLLARDVLARDVEKSWGLRLNPGRLRIMTIDSLNANLVSQMPLLSRYGSMPSVAEDAFDLYDEAAKQTIDLLNDDTNWTHAVGSLVSHLDNRLDYVLTLICNMLAKRDQWLRHVADPEHPRIDRANLEAAFARLIESVLQEILAVWPTGIEKEIIEVSIFSSAYLKEDIKLDNFPSDNIEDLSAWKYIANLILTKDGSLRKKVDKRQGFPAKGEASTKEEEQLFKQQKQKMIVVLERFEDFPEAVKQLHAVSDLPDAEYSENEWEIMQALFEILRISVAQLELVFGEKGSVDFTSISQAALRALGSVSSPTDLALSLDYKISHILVDEFQDTAWSQFELLKHLTAGWQKDDGNTLFIVGDPMQSIYRFREAEVGLFLDAWNQGIGDIELKTLQLKVNFRSQTNIIKWINNSFNKVFPEFDSLEKGAVSYVESIAIKDSLSGQACTVHPFFEKDEEKEADDLLAIINQARLRNPDDSIAVLVRGRTHLTSIIEKLNTSRIKYRAVELEGLSGRPVIQDLLALQKALCNLADRIAWNGVLRAPWCGLTLSDLLRISQFDKNKTIPELLHNEQCINGLSDDGRKRIRRVVEMLDFSMSRLYTRSARNWLEGAWTMLGGPACLSAGTDLEDAEIFFQQLEVLGEMPVYKLQSELIKAVDKLYALPDVEADESLQIMTIHKSKGLEFDTVILPGMGYKPANNDSALIKWFELQGKENSNDLLMAPIKQTGAQPNLKYQLLCDYEKQKDRYESGRLLYVATTRARKYLHIMGHISCDSSADENILGRPVTGSLLNSLWPAVEIDYRNQFNISENNKVKDEDSAPAPDEITKSDSLLVRLKQSWKLPEAPDAYNMTEKLNIVEDDQLVFDWAGESARFIGTAVHEILHSIVSKGIDIQSDIEQSVFIEQARSLLLNSGVIDKQLDLALSKVNIALKNIFSDPKGSWILGNHHKEHSSEFSLTGYDNGIIKHVIIDRTIVDDNGVRWIIDYKTGNTSGNKEDFMDSEQERYSEQLATYANIYRHIDSRPIKLALYFPLFRGWREWNYDD